ncbi:hypothetical protein DEA8626_01797 [Defluviimonas aquaemixtae]|uniref:Uncharacterized protein n=1 Tax=Albidovulum aquaemixtae TaxID=1542388 RepID=A0A2R8B6J7_9RHOB|nr:hypothetical protein [Defluviimonas aquaemixtae]SPH18265.1 hypothetical protein DEA8626_01797 [Defluviimonas aquaemixtae]
MTDLRPVLLLRAMLAALLILGARAGAALAHSFSIGILATGDGAEARLASAVRGFLIASAERDSHPDETSDGHIGGLDVHIVPLPGAAAAGIKGLMGTRPATLDFLLLLDGKASEPPRPGTLPGLTSDTIFLHPGELPETRQDPGRAESFAARFRAAYGIAPDQAAAEGYNAARRIDLAVRPLGTVGDDAALVRSLTETQGRIEW